MQKSFLVALLALCLLLPFQNCGIRLAALSGTETGNANSVPSNPSLARAILASSLISRMCDAQIACDATVEKDSCVSKLAVTEGLAQSFGINPGTGITTMQELATAEEQGFYLPSSSASSACESEISVMTCSVAAPLSSATSAVEVKSATDAAVANSPSCGTVYLKPD